MKLTKPEPIAHDEKTLISFRLDVALFDRFSAECQLADVSMSEGMRQLIINFLNGVHRESA